MGIDDRYRAAEDEAQLEYIINAHYLNSLPDFK